MIYLTLASSFKTITTFERNRSDPPIITLNNQINKQINENKTNTPSKQHFDKIDHKYNPHSGWGTIAKLSNKKPPRKQNYLI